MQASPRRAVVLVLAVVLTCLAASCTHQQTPPPATAAPAATARPGTNPSPGANSPKSTPLPASARSGGEGVGFRGVLGGDGRTAFYGIDPGKAAKIIYVIDRSGSMTNSIDYVKYELKRCISELDYNTEFLVLFLSSGWPTEMPTRRLVPATDRNKAIAFEYIDSIIALGITDPSKALERAFAAEPEVIYLLTDREWDKQIVGLIKRLNPEGKTKVHTIGFIYKTGEPILKEMAAENGGTYRFISEVDLANLGD